MNFYYFAFFLSLAINAHPGQVQSQQKLLPGQKNLIKQVEALQSIEKAFINSMDGQIKRETSPERKEFLTKQRELFLKTNDERIETALKDLVRFDLMHFDAVTETTKRLQTAIHGPDSPPLLVGSNGRVRGPIEIQGSTAESSVSGSSELLPTLEHFNDPLSLNGFDASSQSSVVEAINQQHGVSGSGEHGFASTEHSPPPIAHE